MLVHNFKSKCFYIVVMHNEPVQFICAYREDVVPEMAGKSGCLAGSAVFVCSKRDIREYACIFTLHYKKLKITEL